MPRSRRRWAWLAVLLVIAAMVPALFLRPSPEPELPAAEQPQMTDAVPEPAAQVRAEEPVEDPAAEPVGEPVAGAVFDQGGPELQYGGYRLVLSFYSGDGMDGRANAERTLSQTEGESSNAPSMLFVYRDGRRSWGEFQREVKGVSVTVNVLSGNGLEYNQPMTMEEFPEADLAVRLSFDGDSGSNAVCWTVEMQNGDVLRLYHTFTVHKLERVTITAEDRPLETVEQLQALLDEVAAGASADQVVDIYLPATTYAGGVTVDRSVNLYGNNHGETVFAGPVEWNSESPDLGSISSVVFRGSGQGTGLTARASVWLKGCTFETWETGARTDGDAWIALDETTFHSNGVGIVYDLGGYHYFNNVLFRCSFAHNGVAIRIDSIPGETPLYLEGVSFVRNGEDIQNNIGYPVVITTIPEEP